MRQAPPRNEPHGHNAWVYCGRLRAPDGLDLTDMLEVYAPLLDIPDAVEGFLKRHAFRGAGMREWTRWDDWSVPLDIIREAVINALLNSDYTQQGGPIRVAFYDDRIYGESLGGLLPGQCGGTAGAPQICEKLNQTWATTAQLRGWARRLSTALKTASFATPHDQS